MNVTAFSKETGTLSGVYQPVYNVRTHGAVGDGKTRDTFAIQTAIDACHENGGGTVYFPSGDYLSGTLRIKSHVTLFLDSGATLRASQDTCDYEESGHAKDIGHTGKWYYLIVADGEKHISITGGGTIHGIGKEAFGIHPGEKDKMLPYRIGTVSFSRCSHVNVRDITIRYSGFYTVHLYRCEKVFIDGVSIVNNFYRRNADGITPESCRDVFISNCHIITGDDCICPKTRHGYPCEHIVVTNCTLETAATAIKFGTGSSCDFRDMHFSNCTIRNSGVGIGFYIKDGGTAERITFSNISIGTTVDLDKIHVRKSREIIPIYMDIEKRHESSPVGRIRDVTFRDIYIESDRSILIQGMPERAIENLTIDNVTFRVNRALDYSHRNKRGGTFTTNLKDERMTKFIRKPTYIALAHINGLFLDNIRVIIPEDIFSQFDRSAVAIFETENGIVRSISRQPAGIGGHQPVISMDNCRHMMVTNCFALSGTPVFLGVSGNKTSTISLTGNDLSEAKKTVVITEDVPGDAVKR